MTTANISLPNVTTTIGVDLSALPVAVQHRLLETALMAQFRSAINSAANAAANDAVKAAEEKAKKAKKAFDEKEFRKNFKADIDIVAAATERLNELMSGKVRAARGQSTQNKALVRAVLANIINRLVSRGKKAKEAKTMVGDDPFAFIDKTARKRAGDDENVYKSELAKLEAMYVAPARLLLADEPEAEDGEGDASEGADEAPEEGAEALV